jgi:parallel beta-helix repeat protein
MWNATTFVCCLFILTPSVLYALDITIGTGVDDVCQGNDDASLCIQNAINEVSTAGGGNVFLKRGEYKVSNQITLKRNVALKGVCDQVCCEEPPAKLLKTSNVGHLLYGSSVNNIVLEGLQLSWPQSNGGVSHGIYLRTATYVALTDVWVDSFNKGEYIEKSMSINFNLFKATNNAKAGMEIKTSKDVVIGSDTPEALSILACRGQEPTILNWFEYNSGVGGLYMGQTENIVIYKTVSSFQSWDGFGFKNIKNLVAEKCIATDNGRHGFDIFGYTTINQGLNTQGYSSASVLKDNIISNNYNGVMLKYAHNIGIVENKFLNNKAKGVMVGKEVSHLTVDKSFFTDNGVNGNYAGACGINIGESTPDGFSTNNLNIVNNIMETQRKSICLRNARQVVIDKNLIKRAEWCVQVSKDNDATSITSNTCSTKKGIILEDNATHTVVTGNSIQTETYNGYQCVVDKTVTKQNTITPNLCSDLPQDCSFFGHEHLSGISYSIFKDELCKTQCVGGEHQTITSECGCIALQADYGGLPCNGACPDGVVNQLGAEYGSLDLSACSGNKVIKVQNAWYGDPNNMCSGAEVTSIVQDQCDGRYQCSLFGCDSDGYCGLNVLFGDTVNGIEKIVKVQYSCV